jgi:hypothetical protein
MLTSGVCGERREKTRSLRIEAKKRKNRPFEAQGKPATKGERTEAGSQIWKHFFYLTV